MSLKFNYGVCIATDGKSPKLPQLIARLFEQSEIPVYVVLNGHEINTAEKKLKEQFDTDRLVVVTYPAPGKSKALNHLLSILEDPEEFLIFTDDDMEVNPRWVQNYIDCVEAQGTGKFYGGGFYVSYESAPTKEEMSYFPVSALGLRDEDLVQRPRFLGCNWGAFVGDLKKSGGFNPNFGPGSITRAVGQERNMMDQLVAHGIEKTLVPNNYVAHHVPRERSSFTWALERRWRTGISAGLRKPVNVPLAFLKMCYNFLLSINGDRKRKMYAIFLKGQLRGVFFRRWQRDDANLTKS